METNQILKVANVTKKYGTKKALDKFDMNVNKGDIYGFIGENGSGKTTLMRVITNLTNQTAGEYFLFGVSSKNYKVRNEQKKIRAIIEVPSLVLFENHRKNFINMYDLLGLKINEKEIKNILNLVGLSDPRLEKVKVKNYSLGMKQRLSIGLCLIGNPEFLILDEPMNGLDPKGIIEVRNLIRKINQEKNVTFLISSHVLEELDKVVTKYGFISNGKLIEEITVDKLHERFIKKIEIEFLKTRKNISKLFTGLEEFELFDNKIIFKEPKEINRIMEILVKNEITILNIKTIQETIEDYYLKLIGGRRWKVYLNTILKKSFSQKHL